MGTHSSFPLPVGAADCHAHVMSRNVPLVPDRHSAPARDCSVSEYLQILDTYGVTYGLLTAPSFYGPNNSVLLDALKQAQGRLRGTAIVEPTITEGELALLRDAGVCGLRLNWVRRSQLPDITSADYASLLSKARDLGLHIEVYLEGELLEPVLSSINQSGAAAVIDHFGHPQSLTSAGFKALLRSIDAGNTWVKLSAPFRLREKDARSLASALLAASDGERAVWATDWPWVGFEEEITYTQCIEWLFDWIPDEGLRNRVLVDTPQKLFGFTR